MMPWPPPIWINTLHQTGKIRILKSLLPCLASISPASEFVIHHRSASLEHHLDTKTNSDQRWTLIMTDKVKTMLRRELSSSNINTGSLKWVESFQIILHDKISWLLMMIDESCWCWTRLEKVVDQWFMVDHELMTKLTNFWYHYYAGGGGEEEAITILDNNVADECVTRESLVERLMMMMMINKLWSLLLTSDLLLSWWHVWGWNLTNNPT